MDDAWTDARLTSHDSGKYRDEVYALQVRQLYALAPFGIVATILNSLVIFIILSGVIQKELLVIWLAAIMIISIFRIVQAVRFRRTVFEIPNARSLGNRFIVGLA